MFSLTGLSPSTVGRPRPLQLTQRFLTHAQLGRTGKSNPTTPHRQRLPAITSTWFSLIRFRSPLLTESLLFSLPVGTEMFHFPTFPPHTLYIQALVTRHHSCWVSPFGNPRISARLTAPRGLSQPPTSFIGSWCQGIHRTLLNTYKQRCSRPLCSSQTTHPKKPQPWTNRPTASGITGDPSGSCIRLESHSRVLSGPNSVSTTSPPAGHTGPTDTRGTCQRSTHELPPEDDCFRNGLCHKTFTIPTPRVSVEKCSLERR